MKKSYVMLNNLKIPLQKKSNLISKKEESFSSMLLSYSMLEITEVSIMEAFSRVLQAKNI